MPHASFKILPGVDQNKTPALNEAAISESQLIRFIPDRTLGGLVQKLGGWTKYINDDVGSTVRALWAWEDTNANSYLAAGAEGVPAGGGGALNVIEAGSITDITPQTTTDNVAVDFSTVAGSDVVTIIDTGSNIDDYDVVDIRTHVSVGGLVLFGQYQCFAGSANQFTIRARDALGDPALATATVNNGGAVPVFTLTTGSNFVTVTLNDHGFSVGDTFPILVATSVAGLTLYGNYIVLQVTSTNQFVIAASSAAGLVNVTGASGDGTTVTITHASGITFVDNETVTIASVNPAGYNGNWTVDSSTSGSFTFLDNETGAYVSGGTISGAYDVEENSGNVQLLFYNGIGPLPGGTGYGIGGYGTGGYGTGTAPTSVNTGTPINAIDWTLDNWGETLISCPLDGPIYQWNPTSGDPTALVIPEAPPVNDGMFVAMPQRQIIAWGSTFTGIKDPLLIRWCDVDNYNSWIGLITNQAGSYRIPKGSRIVQCIQGPQQGLIWTDLAVWAMQYAGPPYVYQFNELGTGCGLIGRKAAGSVNGVVYWMGQSQFFRLSGGGVEPIRCPVWDVIFQDLDESNLDKIRIAPNSRFGEVTWYYPTMSNGGEVSHYVKYNFNLDQWDYGTLARTAWINESVLGPPIGAAPDTYIYQHETSPDADGQPMLSSFQTGYFVMNEADVKMFVDQIWPDMKWGYFGGVQDAEVKLTFYVNDYAGQTPYQYGPYTMTQNTTFITPRFRGRLVSIKIESDDIGSFWRLGNIRYRLQQDGKF
jgi:hypothetical protein